MATKCARPGHETVPRLAILVVPSRDGRCFPSTSIVPEEHRWLTQIYWRDPRGHRERGGSPRARGCPPGRIWPLSSASPAAPCVWPTNVSSTRQFAIGLGAAGTRVAERQSRSSTSDRSQEAPPLPDLFHEFGTAPLAFQMGVPSQDAFPFKLWSRILTRETRRAAAARVSYPDPRGDPEPAEGGRGLLRA